jgi:hypothetical protein
MYKIRVVGRKTYYFSNWDAACRFCFLSGVSVKRVEAIWR